MRASRWISLGLVAVSLAGAAGILFQRESQKALEWERTLLREEHQRLAAQRSANEQLRRAQLPESELQRLRADHEALLRLRAEIGDLTTRVETMASQERQAGR